MKDHVLRDFAPADLGKIAGTYRVWRTDILSLPNVKGRDGSPNRPKPNPEAARPAVAPYQDIPGFCKSATLAEITSHGFVLTPGRYVGAEETADDGEPFDEKMQKLVTELNVQFAESAKLESQIRENLKSLGYGG